MLFLGYYGNIHPYPFLAGDSANIIGMTAILNGLLILGPPLWDLLQLKLNLH
jgi:hypothetical protein